MLFKIHKIIISIVATPPPTVQHIEGTCPDERWEEYGSHCYYFEKDSLQVKVIPCWIQEFLLSSFPGIINTQSWHFCIENEFDSEINKFNLSSKCSPLTDPRGAPGTRAPLVVQILSFSCSFRQNLKNNSNFRSWRTPWGKSWISHCSPLQM